MTYWINVYHSKENRIIYEKFDTEESALKSPTIKLAKPIIIAYKLEE